MCLKKVKKVYVNLMEKKLDFLLAQDWGERNDEHFSIIYNTVNWMLDKASKFIDLPVIP